MLFIKNLSPLLLLICLCNLSSAQNGGILLIEQEGPRDGAIMPIAFFEDKIDTTEFMHVFGYKWQKFYPTYIVNKQIYQKAESLISRYIMSNGRVTNDSGKVICMDCDNTYDSEDYRIVSVYNGKIKYQSSSPCESASICYFRFLYSLIILKMGACEFSETFDWLANRLQDDEEESVIH